MPRVRNPEKRLKKIEDQIYVLNAKIELLQTEVDNSTYKKDIIIGVKELSKKRKILRGLYAEQAELEQELQ